MTYGQYNVIYVDLPWEDENWPASRVMALPVREVMQEKSLAAVWVRKPLLPAGLALLDHWGFQYAGLLAWKKPQEETDGFWFRGHCELMLIGIRGSVDLEYLERHSLFESPESEIGTRPDHFRFLLTLAADKAFSEVVKLDLFGAYWKARHPGYDRDDWEFLPPGKLFARM
jgi:N6-adenosine-specific RNA methylase IME4